MPRDEHGVIIIHPRQKSIFFAKRKIHPAGIVSAARRILFFYVNSLVLRNFFSSFNGMRT